MLSIKTTIAILAGLSALVTASPTVSGTENALALQARQQPWCGDVGDCWQNECNPVFPTPNDIVGTCQLGPYAGCYCGKCTRNDGSCSDNGCNGANGKCTAGAFQGCPCR